MALFTNQPPSSRTPYAIPQLEGERITIPGSKGTFRILASSKQTNGLMAVFQSGAVISDAPGFHYHNQAHDVFLVTKGYLKLWNGDKCRIMGPGDFAYVPPKVIHNPDMLGPHTEIYGLITPGDWVDFFRYISEPYEGVLVPESDNRDLKALLIPKVMAAKGKFDVVFQPHYVPPALGEWDGDDEKIPETQAPFFLKANTGPRWMLGGVMSRPFITTAQSAGVCAISSIESSSVYGAGANALGRFMTFESVDHCLCVQEGTLVVRLEGKEDAEFREGETVLIPAGQAFALEFRSRFVRVWSFTDGDGIETLIHRAGQAVDSVVLPEEVGGWDAAALKAVAEELKRTSLGRNGLVQPRPANAADRRSTNATNYIRAHIVKVNLEKKVEELNLKLREAESKLPTSRGDQNPAYPSLNATPCSMPAADRPTPTSKPDLEEPSYSSYDAAAVADEPDEAGDSVEDEITELNHHTNGIEFHGSTSSVAFLGHLQKARDPQQTEEHWPSRPPAPEYSIVSTLHNASFSPNTSAAQSLAAVYDQNYYFEHAHVFMSGYFENIHFIHPLIDKEDFYLRAHELWLRRTPTPDTSFVALYLSVLSFGALLRVWDEVQLGGLSRFEWSRKLFSEAQLYLNHQHFPNNLDAVQCLYLMAKICQNELNPNLAYMYLGLSIRTCLAAGFNRKVRQSTEPRAEWISKTWWGLFSLEIEMSFSLGRPDTLGMDEYHNRPLPPRDSSQYAIIPWMVDFARITRKVSVQIYHRRLTLSEKLSLALAIEAEMDAWIMQLPDHIRPDFVTGESVGRNALRDPKWARRQRVVLGIRYYNVKMLLFRPFLSHFTTDTASFPIRTHPSPHLLHKTVSGSPQRLDPEPEQTELQSKLSETITKCLDAAEKTIAVIHDIYRLHTFFRCWWYNTTYVTFATSTILLPLSKSRSKSNPNLDPGLGLGPGFGKYNHDSTPLRHSVEKAIDILEATDESVVARKCVEIIRYYLREFEDRDQNRGHAHGHRHNQPHNGNPAQQFSAETGTSLYGSEASEGAGAGLGLFDAGGESGLSIGAGFGEGFDVPEWAYGFGFPDYSFEGIARFFDEIGDPGT
ncbi:hypothetical protein BJX99DRAFT_270197 [Aspergillus californicus]